MAIDVSDIEAAISRALLNGESWEMGDIKSHIGLDRLMELQDRANANSNGMQFHLATFQDATTEDDE